MATNEPMSDTLLQAIRKFNTVERGVPRVVVSDITALLAEVDRLRAREQALADENQRLSRRELVKSRDRWLSVAQQRQAQIDAMRPVVEAVAAGDMTYSDPEFGDVNCIFNCAPGSRFGFHHAANCQARAAQAFVAAHPATAADGEGQ